MGKRLVLLALIFLPVFLPAQNPDIRILRSINSPQTLRSDKFFGLVSNSDAWLIFTIPAGIGTAGLIKHDDRLIRNACVTLAAATLDFGITTALKYSINRDRPFITYPDIKKKSDGGSPSFPSGHTSGAFSVATSLSLAYPRWYIVAPAYTWAGTVGYSRMHLGVHYPSDVFIGALVGSGSAYLTYRINQKLLNSKNQKH
jgi:membrane-associated phospholipid phosphatase